MEQNVACSHLPGSSSLSVHASGPGQTLFTHRSNAVAIMRLNEASSLPMPVMNECDRSVCSRDFISTSTLFLYLFVPLYLMLTVKGCLSGREASKRVKVDEHGPHHEFCWRFVGAERE